MTSQNSTTDKKSVGFMQLFSFSTKQFWTTILLFTIILFFVLPVPVLMAISDRQPMNADELARLKRDFVEDWAPVIRYAVIAIMSVFGVVLSISRFKYLKNKVSVDFYHSLPIKRGQLFLTQLGVSAVSLLIPYIFNILFTLTVIASNGVSSDALLASVIVMSAESFVYTVFFYALSTLVGMVSGLGAVQLTLTLVAIFIVPAVYITILGFLNIFNENMWFSYYANMGLFEKLSPVFRFTFNTEPLFIWEAVTMVLTSALILICAYFVYMQRKSERAGTPVVFPVLGEIIKYVLVFLGTLLGGLLFYYIMDSFFWTVFGMICGMVLVFMLANTILNKTARSMFKGWKGLCIFAVCAALSFTVLVTNAFGINTRIPSPENISHIAVNFDNGTCNMEFRDPEVIAALTEIYTESDYDGDDKYYLPTYWYDYMYMEIVFYPKFGIPNAKTVRVHNKSAFMEQFRTVLDSDEFKLQYINTFDKVDNGEGYVYLTLQNRVFNDDGTVTVLKSEKTSWNYPNFELYSNTAKKLGLPLLREENKACGFDFFQQPSFGRVILNQFNGYDHSTVIMYMFDSMNTLTSHYVDSKMLTYTPEEIRERLAGIIDEIAVYRVDENGTEKMVVSNKDLIEELLAAAVNPTGNDHSVYTFVETDYYAEYTLNRSDRNYDEVYYDEYGNEYANTASADPKEIYTYSEPVRLAFILGKLPDFVTEALEK